MTDPNQTQADERTTPRLAMLVPHLFNSEKCVMTDPADPADYRPRDASEVCNYLAPLIWMALNTPGVRMIAVPYGWMIDAQRLLRVTDAAPASAPPNQYERTTLEQIVRDVLTQAVEDGIVFWSLGRDGAPATAEQWSAGDLVGCANLLRDRLAAPAPAPDIAAAVEAAAKDAALACDDDVTEQRHSFTSCLARIRAAFAPLVARLTVAEAEREKLRKAALWLAHNKPGTPVPEWVDAALASPSPTEART